MIITVAFGLLLTIWHPCDKGWLCSTNLYGTMPYLCWKDSEPYHFCTEEQDGWPPDGVSTVSEWVAYHDPTQPAQQKDLWTEPIERSLLEHPLEPPPHPLCLSGDYKTPVTCNQNEQQELPKDCISATPNPDGTLHRVPCDRPMEWPWDALAAANQNKVLVIPGGLTDGTCRSPEDITIRTHGGKGKVYCLHIAPVAKTYTP